MTDNTNGNDTTIDTTIDPTVPPTVPPTADPTVDVATIPTPRRTPRPRRGATVPTTVSGPVPTPSTITKNDIDGLVAVARTVTPANFSAVVARYTANHGVTHAGRNVGRVTNDRIVAFQNRIMRDNATWQLDDAQIAAMARIEFPMGTGKFFAGTPADGVAITRGIRAEYNRPGHHGATFAVTAESVSYGAKRFAFPDAKPTA